MTKAASHLIRHSLAVVAAAGLFAGCSEDVPFSPDGAGHSDIHAQFAKAPDLGVCQELQVPVASKVAFHAYAEGVQIYSWNGTSWTFVAPDATLFGEDGVQMGTHYAGPTWESVSGSYVKAKLSKPCTPDAGSIAWLLLEATSTSGPGIFRHVNFIQRLNTAGGKAPANAGTFVGEVARMPYTADYYFYRAQ
jgi:hypothetical protein